MQLNVFFPTNKLYNLKSFISATSNSNFYFFLPLLGFRVRASYQDDQKQFFQTKMLVFVGSCVHPINT